MSEETFVLKGIAPVRLRPGMYIGDTDIKGYHRLLEEIVENSIQEAMAGYCDKISVTLQEDDTLVIEDNGRGIPIEGFGDNGEPILQLIFTELRAYKQYHEEGRKIRGGLHGVGLCPVNALSELLIADSYYDGNHYRVSFAHGEPTSDLENLGAETRHGTTITIRPDRQIFGDDLHFSPQLIRNYLQKLAFLNPAIRFFLNNAITGKQTVFNYREGIIDWVQGINRRKIALHDPIYASLTENGNKAQVVFQYHTGCKHTLKSFMNTIEMIDESDEIVGFYTGLASGIGVYMESIGILSMEWKKLIGKGISEWLSYTSLAYPAEKAKELAKLESTRLFERMRRGMTVIISVWMQSPQFGGCTRRLLRSPEMKKQVSVLVSEAFLQFCAQQPETARELIRHITGK